MSSPASSGRGASCSCARSRRRPRARSCVGCCAAANSRRCGHERISPSRARRRRGDDLDRPPAEDEHDDRRDAERGSGDLRGARGRRDGPRDRHPGRRGQGVQRRRGRVRISHAGARRPRAVGRHAHGRGACRKPVIAAIDGYTMGAGLELAVACDFRVATLRSEFAFPEVRLGMIPGSGGTQRAVRLMGMTRAKLFMMTGQRISAERAEAWGLITQVVPDDGLDAAVQALAGELAERAPLALRTLKMVLNRGADAPLETALELERKAYAWLRSTHDYAEGVTSFLEKCPPKYTGR